MKVAISVPDPIFHEAEMLASALNKPRSQIYAEALESYVRAHRARNVTQRINSICERESTTLDPALAAAQFRALSDEAW
jgi:metal-responsive CopG/Arc/MetJ family transcriptional regulator